MKPVWRLHADPFLLLLELSTLLSELLKLLLAILLTNLFEILRIVQLLELVGFKLEVVDVLFQLFCV
jgi:hypothetical protein